MALPGIPDPSPNPKRDLGNSHSGPNPAPKPCISPQTQQGNLGDANPRCPGTRYPTERRFQDGKTPQFREKPPESHGKSPRNLFPDLLVELLRGAIQEPLLLLQLGLGAPELLPLELLLPERRSQIPQLPLQPRPAPLRLLQPRFQGALGQPQVLLPLLGLAQGPLQLPALRLRGLGSFGAGSLGMGGSRGFWGKMWAVSIGVGGSQGFWGILGRRFGMCPLGWVDPTDLGLDLSG